MKNLFEPFFNFQSKIRQQLPVLLNAIRMIYSISEYYNNSERMTSLFIKITNQMVVACRKYVTDGVSRIWDLPRYVYMCICYFNRLFRKMLKIYCFICDRFYFKLIHVCHLVLQFIICNIQWNFKDIRQI